MRKPKNKKATYGRVASRHLEGEVGYIEPVGSEKGIMNYLVQNYASAPGLLHLLACRLPKED